MDRAVRPVSENRPTKKLSTILRQHHRRCQPHQNPADALRPEKFALHCSVPSLYLNIFTAAQQGQNRLPTAGNGNLL